MWWIIIIIGIIAFIAYKVFSSHSKDVKHITQQGGMKAKYSLLIEFLEYIGATIQEETKDSITLTSKTSTLVLEYVFGLVIRMVMNIPGYGAVKKTWEFPENYPQEKMIEEINEFFNQLTTKYTTHIDQKMDQLLKDEYDFKK